MMDDVRVLMYVPLVLEKRGECSAEAGAAVRLLWPLISARLAWHQTRRPDFLQFRVLHPTPNAALKALLNPAVLFLPSPKLRLA